MYENGTLASRTPIVIVALSLIRFSVSMCSVTGAAGPPCANADDWKSRHPAHSASAARGNRAGFMVSGHAKLTPDAYVGWWLHFERWTSRDPMTILRRSHPSVLRTRPAAEAV